MTSPHATSIWFLTCLLAKGPWTYAGPTLCSPNIHINSHVVLNMRNAAIPNCLLRFTSKSLKLLWGGLTSFYNVEENAISHEIRNDTFQEVDSSNDSDQKIFKSEICAKYRPAYQASLRVSLAFIWVKVWVRSNLSGSKYGLVTIYRDQSMGYQNHPRNWHQNRGFVTQKLNLQHFDDTLQNKATSRRK